MEKLTIFEQSDYLDHLPKKLRDFRLKNWHYWSVKTPDFFLGSAVVQLNYLAKMFFYAFDLKENKLVEYSGLSLGGRHLEMDAQKSRWHKGNKSIRIQENSYFEFELPKISGKLNFISLSKDFELLHEFEKKNQLALTKKNSTYRVKGQVQFQGQNYEVMEDQSFGVTDWTKSWAKRITTWKWASFSGKDKENKFHLGLNLSTQVYEDSQGNGKENILWINETAYILKNAHITPPSNPTSTHNKCWNISAIGEKVSVKLTLIPLGVRKDYTNVGILKSDFIQPFGYYNGTIEMENQTIFVENLFGVAEEHYAKW